MKEKKKMVYRTQCLKESMIPLKIIHDTESTKEKLRKECDNLSKHG